MCGREPIFRPAAAYPRLPIFIHVLLWAALLRRFAATGSRGSESVRGAGRDLPDPSGTAGAINPKEAIFPAQRSLAVWRCRGTICCCCYRIEW